MRLRLRLLAPGFLVVMTLALLTFPETPDPTPAWQLMTFAASFTGSSLLFTCILARLTGTGP